ncbi:MAG: hypothetical protein HC842_02400 [Cytophagales bacterium]|nr:hypothetical protein [Cytophagales bacterium]
MVTIKHTTNSNSFDAGASVAKDALEGLNQKPSWAIVFCAGKQEPEKVMEGLRSVLGSIPIVGGSAVGVISNEFYGYEGFEVSITLFGEGFAYKTIQSAAINPSERTGGLALGQQLRATVDKEDTILLFYDTLKSSPPPMLYVGGELLGGLREGLGADDYRILGAGLVADMGLMGSFIFTGDRVQKHQVTAVVLPKEIAVDYRILHGCEPISSYMTITKIEGATVFEIDNRPALDVILETLGMEKTEENIKSLTTVVTLGENHGELFGDYDESKYVNRLIIFGNPENGSVQLFEADFKVGSEIQIMSRSNELMIQSAQKMPGNL